MADFDDDDEYAFEPPKPHWQCNECGHVDYTRAMPVDRERFYAKLAEGIVPKCPKCHSEAFVPSGF